MALRVLTFTIEEASYMFTHTQNGHMNQVVRDKFRASKDAFLFVSGTGLDIMFEAYNIALNPESVRQKFFDKFKIVDTRW